MIIPIANTKYTIPISTPLDQMSVFIQTIAKKAIGDIHESQRRQTDTNMLTGYRRVRSTTNRSKRNGLTDNLGLISVYSMHGHDAKSGTCSVASRPSLL